MTDQTTTRDSIIQAISITQSALIERKERGHMINTPEDAYKLFYWAMMEVSDVKDDARDILLERLLMHTINPRNFAFRDSDARP